VAALAPVLWDESSQREEAGPYEHISQEDRTLALNWTETILDAILADPAKRAALQGVLLDLDRLAGAVRREAEDMGINPWSLAAVILARLTTAEPERSEP
jgi:hypothetical protein